MNSQNKLLIIGAAFAIAAVLISSLVLAQDTSITTQTSLEKKDAPAAGESALSFSQTSQQDSDEDGVSDYDEINLYGTDYLRESTDGDAYDDGQELFGYSPASYGNLGGQMPSYIKWPGNSPFVAAYPEIEISIDPAFKVFIKKTLLYQNSTQISVEHTFGTIVTRGITSSVGVGGSHTAGGYREVSNSQADAKFAQEWRNSFNSNQVIDSQTYISSKGDELKYGATFPIYGEAKALLPIPAVELTGHIGAEPYIGKTVSTEDKTMLGRKAGIYAEVTEGGATVYSRAVQTANKAGAFGSGTISTTTSNEISTSISVVDLYTIGTAEEWTEGWSQETIDSAILRFKFNVQNVGADRATKISDLRFTVKIGPYEKTYPSLDKDGIKLAALYPGETDLNTYFADVSLTLDELREFDTKGKVQIYVEDYNLGDSNEEGHAQSAYDGGVLFIVDDGTKDDGTNLQYFLVHAEPDDTYFDLIRRLNFTIPVSSPNNLRKALDFVVVNSTVQSIKGLEVADNAAWFIQTEGISDLPFLFKGVNGGGRKAILTYSKDSDSDYYPDRVERRAGTDINDKNSYPQPQIIAALIPQTPKLELQMNTDGKLVVGKVTMSGKVKLKNNGNYDAYGLEARLFSPDDQTNITQELAGGAVRIKPSQEIILNDTLSWAASGAWSQSGTNLASLSRGAVGHRFYGNVGLPEAITGPIDNNIIDGDTSSGIGSDGTGNPMTSSVALANYEIINKVGLFVKGNTATYTIYVSADGIKWEKAADGAAYAGQFTTAEFSPKMVKYVAITTGRGDAEPYSLNEIQAFGYQFNGKSAHEIKPPVVVLYNVPSGDQRIITDEKISNANESIEMLSGKMMRSIKLDISAPESITYGTSADILVSFVNPYSSGIQGSKLKVSFIGPDGNTVKGYEESADFPQGTRTIKVILNTADLNKSLIDQQLAVFAAVVDHNGVMIAETLEAVKIENPVKILNYAPGDVPQKIVVQKGETKQFAVYASANTQLIYKWFLDGVQITNAAANTYAHNANSVGNHTLKVLLTDGNYENSHNWSLEVNGIANRAPTLEPIANITHNIGGDVIAPIVVTPRASDPDGDTLTFRFVGELIFGEAGNGVWRSYPIANGTFPITVTVTDISGAAASQNFTVFVNGAANNSTLPCGDCNGTNTTDPRPPVTPGTPGNSGGGGGGASSGGSSKCNIGYELVNGKCAQKETSVRADQQENKNSSAQQIEKPAVQVKPQTDNQKPITDNKPTMASGLLTAVKNPRSVIIILAVLIGSTALYLFTRKYKISIEMPTVEGGSEQNEQ